MRTQTSQKAELFARALRKVFLGVFAVCACIVVSSLVRPDLTAAATSNTINFQARLETNAGAIVPDGNYNVEFKLYSVATLGSAEWTEDYTYNSGPGSTDVRLRVANGYLTANLGSITAFPGTINWNQQQWLTMNIGGTVSSGPITWDGEMSPRLQLTAVPYAFAAGTLSTTDGSGNTGTLSFGTVTNNPVITLPNASGTVCLQSSSACGFATGSGTAFLQGGNSFGAQGVLGTNDNNGLAFETNGNNRLTLDNTGTFLTFLQASTINVAQAATALSLTIRGGAATSGTNVGGNLILQGGAGASTGASGSVIVKANTNDSTTAFQVQNASGNNLLTVDTTNTAIVLGNDGTPSTLTVRGGAATGSNTQGANLTIDASNGTGVSGSGAFIFRTATGDSNSVTYDNSAKVHDPGAAATTQTISNFTVGNHTNRLLLVVVTTQSHALATTTGVTFGGSNLTQLDTQNCPTIDFNPSCHVELWYMLNPAISTANIVATVSGGASDYVDVSAVSYYNVNQTTPFGTETHASGGSSPTSNSVTSGTTQLVYDALGSDGAGISGSNTSGATARQINNGGVVENAIQDKAGSSGSTAIGWKDTFADWVEMTVPVNPIADSNPDTLTDRLHITAAGNVGIDNSNPQYALDVVGSGNFSTSVLSPTLDTATAVTLNIGTSLASGIIIGSASTGTTTLQSNGGVKVSTLTAATSNSAAVCRDTSTKLLTACDGTNTTGTAFLQGGNSFGAQGVLGTNDSNSLAIRTNNTNKLVIDTSGNLQLQQASTFNIASASGGSQLTIQAGANSTAAGTGGTLLLQGGAPGTTGASGSVIVKANTNDSTTAFEVQNAAGTSTVLNVDTKNIILTVNGDIADTFNATPGLTQTSLTTTTATAPAGATNPVSVAVQGKYAYVVESGSSGKLQIFDVTNVGTPESVSVTSLNQTSPIQIQVQGHYAYIAEQGASNGKLEIFDISNPKSPTSVAAVAPAGSGSAPQGVYVSGRYAYLTDSGNNNLVVYDISNPTSPVVLSTTATNAGGPAACTGSNADGNSPRKVYVQGRYAYVASAGSSTGRLGIFDMNNPAAPALVGCKNANAGINAMSVYVEGRYAYMTEYASLLRVVDVSDPTNPTTLTTLATDNGLTYQITGAGRYVFTSGDTAANRVDITDIANPGSPSDLQSYSTNVNDPRGMFFDGRYLYVANNGGNTLQILDVTGLEVTAATIHSLEAGNLSVDTNSYFGGDASIQGGLTVGGAAQVNDNLGVSGTAEFVSNTNSTKAFQVQNSSGANLLTVDTSNTAIVLGNDATPAALTVRGGAASGTNVAGANITFDASNGTGSAASGDILFRTAAPNAAAVASGDHTEFEGYNQAALSTTFNVTSHSNMVMVVGVNQQDSTQTVTSISWNGSTAGWTKIGSQTNAAGGVVELWYLVAPTSGSHTLQVNLLNTSGNNHQFAAAATFYNVNQTTPIGNSNTASSTGTSTSVTVNSSVNQDVVDVVGNNSFCLGTPGSGQTRIWADTLGPNTIFGGSYKTAVAGTTTMTWSQTSSCGWETVAASLNLVSGTTADTLTDRLHITADGNVGIDNANPQYALDVSGSGNFNTSVLSPILDTATAVALNIGTTNASSINLGNVTSNIQTTINGTVLIKPTSGHDSSTAFQVQTASGSSVLTVDTSNTRVGIGINIPSNTFSASPLDYATGTVCSTATAGGVTCSGTSTTFLLGGGTTWAASMIGDTVVFADGTVKTITAFTDGNHVTLSGAVNEGPAATYKFYHTGLQVTSAGNTYIQNTSTTALQVQNGAGSALLAVDTVNTQVQVTGDTSGAAVGPLVVRSTSSGSSIGAALTVDASPASGGHSWSFLSTGPGAGTGAGYFGFYDGTSSAYRMVINPSGYVGINTVNPQTVLDVVGETTMEASGTGITGAVALVKGNADGNAVGPLVVKALDANGVGAALTLDSTVSTGGHSWSFLATGAGAAAGAGSFSYYDGTAGAYRLTVGPTGNVGIGITAPTNLFSVSPQDAYGSATRTNGSATIVGSGTGWSNAQVGDVIDFSGGYTNTVVSVADATHLTVASSYGGTTDGSPVSFVLYKPGFNATSSGTAYIQGNSTNEFQIQAAGTAGTGSVLNVDTTNTMLSFNGGQNGAVGAFTTSANTMPAVMYQTSTTVSNGYIYAMGGSDSSLTENSHVYYAQLNGDGSIGSWQTDANSLPATSRAAHGVSYNGYLYYVGGVSGGSSLNTVYYAKQNKDGSTGTWSATTALPNTVGNMGVVISNGYLYSIGSRDTPYTNVYYGKINDDGSIGSWTSGTSLPAGRWAQLSVVANGHIYSIAGYDGSGTQQSTVYDAPLNTDGSLGSWTTTTSLPVVMNYVEGGVANGYVYVVGGNGPGAVAVNTIYYAKMNADGTLGSWATNTNTLPQTNDGPGVVLTNGYIYVVGGGVWSTSAFNTLEYASTARLSVSGSLDLVGLTTGQLTSQSSTGGSIYAGSIYSVGNLTVQGNSQLGAGLGVGGVLAATGDVLLQDATNSTTAFKIQNATGSIALLAADTTNNRITLGSGSGSNVTILVLGSKSDAGDPTGVNGAMYYNANLGKFRCYQSSAWVNCAGGTASEFGDGSDGSLTFDGTTTILGMVPSSSTYTLTRDIYGVNITVNSGVTILASGFRIFATGTFTNNGTVSANGGNGTNASAGTNGQGGTTPVGFYQSGGTGGQGGGGIAGSQGGTTTYGQLGGNGGTGGTNTNAGGAGGSSQPTAAEGGLQAIKVYSVAVTGELQYLTGISTMAMIGGGGGGGGGGSSSTANRGGGGGGGGGVIFIAALSIVNNGTISANGGNGGNGNGSGGVGGGGGGGLVMTFSSSYSGSAGTATAGTKGTAGSTTSATDGSAGLVLQESI